MVHKWFPDKDRQGYFHRADAQMLQKITIATQKVTIPNEIILYGKIYTGIGGSHIRVSHLVIGLHT